MKTFLYRGYDRDGSRKKGVIEALDIKDAREKLARLGVLCDSVEAATDASGAGGITSRRGPTLNHPANRAEWYRALAHLLMAGLPVAAALEILMEQPTLSSTRITREIASMRDLIRDGAGLARAISESSVTLSAFESAVLESGEKTGRMPDVLQQVADYLDDAARVRQTLQTACVYPVVILVLALAIGVGVMGFLVPQMAEMFEESGMALPWLTRAVMAIGQWVLPVFLPAFLLGAALTAAWWRRQQRDPRSRMALEQRWTRLPWMREGFRLLVTTRFARTCSLLLSGGLPLVDAMALAGKATGSAWLGHVLLEKAEEVRHGKAFSAALATVPVLGETLSSWVRAGEASGDVTGMFQHAAKRHHEMWTQFVQRSVTLIEPALIILVAVFVLLIALAILLPILSLNQQLA